jgi:hypothetical protein
MLNASARVKRAVNLSLAAASAIGIAAIVDMITGYPFAGQLGFDIPYLIGAILVLGMGYDVWSDWEQPRFRGPSNRRSGRFAFDRARRSAKRPHPAAGLASPPKRMPREAVRTELVS